MPHGRGGKVDKIALRTAAPFHRKIGVRHAGIKGARICRAATSLAAVRDGAVEQFSVGVEIRVDHPRLVEPRNRLPADPPAVE